jgi:hypothetical protein
MTDDVEDWRHWKQDYRYQISSHGRVRNRFGKILRAHPKPSGRLRVTLAELTEFVDVLVLDAFDVHPPKDTPRARIFYVDGDPRNCRLDNLDWRDPERANTLPALPCSTRLADGQLWAQLPGCPYEVSEAGAVRVQSTGRVMAHHFGKRKVRRPRVTMPGYMTVYVDLLVLHAFRGAPPRPKGLPAYRDFNPSNCALSNLMWSA